MPHAIVDRALFALPLLVLAGCGGGGSAGMSGSQSAVSAPGTQAPVAAVRAAEAVLEGSLVTLDGSSSRDPADGPLSFLWRQTAGPPIALAGADSAAASFTAPAVSTPTALDFQLTVTGRSGLTGRDGVAVVVQPRTFSISGTITVVPGTAADGDVNDWSAPRTANDRQAEAQSIVQPVTVGGYVNLPGSGAPGPLQVRGDSADFYRVALSAGQTVTLLTADPDLGDADLYLWDDAGNRLIDASLDTGAIDALTVSAEGDYLAEVVAARGASNYTLVAGESAVPAIQSGMRLSADFVPGEIVFQERAAMSIAAATTMAAVGVRRIAGASRGGPALARLDPEPSTTGAAVDTGPLAGLADADARWKYRTLLAVKAMRMRRSMIYAQPNLRVHATSTPSDPLYPLQWHYAAIGLPAAWDLTTGDPAVTVAVVDSGVLADHPDLAGRLLPGYDFVRSIDSSGDGDGLDPDPEDPGDEDGAPSAFHGTHVAGTVAAVSENGIGGTGAAPGVRVMPVRVLGTKGGSSYDIIQGLRYAAGLDNDSGTLAPAAQVINLSLGRRGPCWPAEQSAFDEVHDAGVVVVAAAGNDAVDAADAFPANCDHVLAVGAVDARGTRTSYSNFGSAVDVLAPGGSWEDLNGDGHPEAVLSLTADDTVAPVRFGYGFKTGTSMASPHVAAVVALMKSVNPALTPDDVDRLLVAGAMTGDGDIVDAYAAVSNALKPRMLPLPEPRLAVTPNALDFGSTYNYAKLDVRVSGEASVAAVVPEVSEPWLRVVPVFTDGDSLRRYAVTADRSRLAAGSYAATVTFGSELGAVDVPVTMKVTDGLPAGDAGHLYVLLIDRASGRPVRQVEVSASGGVYSYAFPAVDDGRYAIVAGSDADNDLTICDPGESCGSYPPPDESAELMVDADRTAVDFTVGRVVSVAGEVPRSGLETLRGSADGGSPDKLPNVYR